MNRECIFFFEGKGSRQLELLLVEAANGVTPAIQCLKICSGVITPRILIPWILGGVNNPNNPHYVRQWVLNIKTDREKGGGVCLQTPTLSSLFPSTLNLSQTLKYFIILKNFCKIIYNSIIG